MAVTNLPSTSTMYRALVDRNSEFEGVFFVGVRTTGIFCRPTCPSKKPKPENVEFFPSPKEALLAGYRPCLRCQPLDRDTRAPELVTRLRKLVDESPSGKISEADLRERGIDPSTARRQFNKYYGMTFQAYHRARRMGAALSEIRNGESVIGAQIDTGFESASGFYEAFRQIFGAPPSDAARTDCLLAQWLDTPLGSMIALGNDQGIHLFEFTDRRALEAEVTRLRRKFKCAVVPGSNAHLEKFAAEVGAYFDGTSFSFTVPLVTTGTPFEKAVWSKLQTIPAGETRSYSDMAKGIGSAGAVRAVGRANGRNCIAIAIPCHRVIKADGSLCGYGGGVWRKKWLLEHERKFVSPDGSNLSLFDER